MRLHALFLSLSFSFLSVSISPDLWPNRFFFLWPIQQAAFIVFVHNCSHCSLSLFVFGSNCYIIPPHTHTLTHKHMNALQFRVHEFQIALFCFVSLFIIVYACIDDIFRHDFVSISEICGAIRLTLILIKRR